MNLGRGSLVKAFISCVAVVLGLCEFVWLVFVSTVAYIYSELRNKNNKVLLSSCYELLLCWAPF